MKKSPYGDVIDFKEEQKEYSRLGRGTSQKYANHSEWEAHIRECVCSIKKPGDLYNFKKHCQKKGRVIRQTTSSFVSYIVLFITFLLDKVFKDIPEWALMIWLTAVILFVVKKEIDVIRESYFYTDIIEVVEKMQNDSMNVQAVGIGGNCKGEGLCGEKIYTRCFIAFLDILGFKQFIHNAQCKEVLAVFRDIRNPLIASYIGDENGVAQEILAAKKIKTKVMSDSICFYIDAEEPDALNCLIHCCGIFQAKLLKRKHPILTRGAIVLGDIYNDGDITFGPGLSKGYLMEENNAKYPRIILTTETIAEGEKLASSPRLRELLWMGVSCDSDQFYYVNSLDTLFLMEPQVEGDTMLDRYQKLMKHTGAVLGSTTDSSVREKYVYLQDKVNLHYGRCRKS